MSVRFQWLIAGLSVIVCAAWLAWLLGVVPASVLILLQAALIMAQAHRALAQTRFIADVEARLEAIRRAMRTLEWQARVAAFLQGRAGRG